MPSSGSQQHDNISPTARPATQVESADTTADVAEGSFKSYTGPFEADEISAGAHRYLPPERLLEIVEWLDGVPWPAALTNIEGDLIQGLDLPGNPIAAVSIAFRK